MYKTAEVRGVLAAFCDAGLVKVASADAFDDLTEKVAYCLNDYYTVDDVADATSYVIKLAEDAKKPSPSLWNSTKNYFRDFGNAAKNYAMKDLGFGAVRQSFRELSGFNKGKNNVNVKEKALLDAINAYYKKNPNVKQLDGKQIKELFKDEYSAFEKATNTRKRLWGRAGKNVLKSLGKTSVPLLALYGGGKLLGGLFGSDRPEYY